MKHADLIARLEKLTGPDREVDKLITETFGDTTPIGLPRCAGYIGIGAFSGSIDAAVALVERMLPGCDICWQDLHADFRQEGEVRHIAEVMHDLRWVTHDGFPEPVYATAASGKADTRPIALLIALLRALQESDPAKDEAQ